MASPAKERRTSRGLEVTSSTRSSITLTTKESKKSTFGWARAEITGALINAVFLVALCFSIFTSSIQRLVFPEEIEQPKTLLIVGVVGLVVNFFGLVLFFNETFGDACSRRREEDETAKVRGHDNSVASPNWGIQTVQPQTDTTETDVEIDEDDLDFPWLREKTKNLKSGSQMNIRGVFLHILGDALGSVVVVLSALVVMYCEGSWRYLVDPGLSVIMVIIIVSTTIPLIKQTSFILLQHLPSRMAVPDMLKEMYQRVRGLHGAHEFHIWQLVGSRMIASLHIKSANLHDYMIVSKKLKRFFHQNGIHSLTIQPEFTDEETRASIGDSECSMGCSEDCPEVANSSGKSSTSQIPSLGGLHLDKSPYDDDVFTTPKKHCKDGTPFPVHPAQTAHPVSDPRTANVKLANETEEGLSRF